MVNVVVYNDNPVPTPAVLDARRNGAAGLPAPRGQAKRQVDVQEEGTLFLLHHLQAVLDRVLQAGFVLHPHAFHAEAGGDLHRVDAVQNHAGVFAGLLHGTFGQPEEIGDDAVGLVVGDDVEHRNGMMHRRPQPRVRIEQRAVADQTHHRTVRRRQLQTDCAADAIAFRPAGGPDVNVVAGARWFPQTIKRQGELLDHD